MDRRHFLSTTALGGLGLALWPGKAKAFALQDCDSAPGEAACRAIADHRAVIEQINVMLAAKGLDETQRKAVLAVARCPFCGEPLLPG